uniref:Uncharacterized protein n=1 Tax=Anopheles darlingi TaxID=43151 RepID=A0A2M4D8W1_ANODA
MLLLLLLLLLRGLVLLLLSMLMLMLTGTKLRTRRIPIIIHMDRCRCFGRIGNARTKGRVATIAPGPCRRIRDLLVPPNPELTRITARIPIIIRRPIVVILPVVNVLTGVVIVAVR